MKTIKDILEKLEELETNEDKLNYLYEILDEIEDEDLINNVKTLIQELDESLETKLENIEVPIRRINREMDFDDIELDVEEVQRNIARPQARPDLVIRQNEEEESSFNYTSNTNYASAQLYSQGSFDYQTLQRSSQDDFMKNNLIRESILSPEGAVTELEKENLSRKLRETMPGSSEEQIIMYQSRITDELKKDVKSKYVARLK